MPFGRTTSNLLATALLATARSRTPQLPPCFNQASQVADNGKLAMAVASGLAGPVLARPVFRFFRFPELPELQHARITALQHSLV